MILTHGTKPIDMRKIPNTKKPIKIISIGNYIKVEIDTNDTKRIVWLKEKGFNES